MVTPHAYFTPLAGIEWSLDNDASNTAVLVASEAHAITLAIEGLLGVVFTVATLTDEAVDVGEVIPCAYYYVHSRRQRYICPQRK